MKIWKLPKNKKKVEASGKEAGCENIVLAKRVPEAPTVKIIGERESTSFR